MKVLECSSAGDKRFSAFYASVNAFGKNASIEEHYQLSKRFGERVPRTIKEAKGKKPTHIELNGKSYPLEFLSQWYKLLWLKYLDCHPDLVKYASQFDIFTDKFRGKAVNCQADVIKQYVKNGRDSLLEECIELIELMSKDKK
ncbi:DUF6977 family protein [Aneurinibacillus thermoaerophilus]|jgi:hypothetical protein|uniref:DarT1-associated NADAR antitoxin family protein n=1 Tax=Aneurinibacillus thermoaerophilus TaxID=143495 RepID=UPI002E23327A|nr:hypothetical protein [Aneurinibacillus thermoaerophilus]